MSCGTGDEGFCECGAALVPSRYWIHDDDALAATAGMALGCRPYLRPFWLLCSALLAALGAAGPCLLLNLPHPPAWTLPGWPEPVFGDAPPWYLLAAAGGISGWLMAYWWLPYAEDEQSV